MSWTYNPLTNNFDFYKDPYSEGALSAFNGTFQESFNALVTSDGATITMSVEQSGGGDLSMNFSDGKSTLDCTPNCTIALTAGTDASPQVNYIYVLQSSKVLTKSTSTWPTAEHIKIAYFLVPSATFVQTNGVYINQNWNDHFVDTNNQGHISHMAERSRHLGAIYASGVAGAGTDGYLTPTASNVELKATSGVIYQMHKHTVSAFDTSVTDTVLVTNWSGDAYHDISNLFDIVADSTGATIGSNKYFNIIIWGVANKGGEYTPMMLNVPSGFYNTQSDAENDVSGYDVSTIPSEYKTESSTGFLIARITCKMSTTWTVTQTIDLRGTDPASIAGGSGIGGGVTAYIDLTDTPTTYTGSAGYTVKVNSDENAVEFVAPVTTDYTIYVSDSTYGASASNTGLVITSGTADGTGTKLVIDSTANFTAALVGKTVYNVTDNKWAIINTVDSTTQLTTQQNATVTSGNSYVVASALDSIQAGHDIIPDGYLANITVFTNNLTFTEDLDFSGKHSGAPGKKITILGHATLKTKFTGDISIGEPIYLNRLSCRGRVFEYFGADVDWTDSENLLDDGFIIRKSDTVNNVFNSSMGSYVFANDSGKITDVVSTVTTTYDMFLATSTFGGVDTNDGLMITQGSGTSTTSNKLVDSTANFNDADHLNMTVWNSTDNTWAKISAVDSTTTLSISADIMASGESYIIGAAKLTLQSVFDAIPSTIAVGASPTVRCSNGTFTANPQLEGKSYAGPDGINIYGTEQIDYTGLTATGGVTGGAAIPGTFTDTGLTADQFNGKLVRPSSGNNSGDIKRVDTNTTTAVTLIGLWGAAPGADTYEIISPATIFQDDGSFGLQVKAGQLGVQLQMITFDANTTGKLPLKVGNHGEVKGATYCDFTGDGHVAIETYSNAQFNECYFPCWNTSTKRGVRVNNSASAVFNSSKILRPASGGGGEVVILGDISRVTFIAGTVVDGNGATNAIGIATQRHGQGIFTSGAMYNTIRNCAVGIDVTELSLTVNALTHVTYSGNTINNQADPTSVVT